MKIVRDALAAASLLALAACGGGGANNASDNQAANDTAPLTGDLNTTTPSTIPPVNTGGARFDPGDNVTTTDRTTNTAAN